MLFERSEYNEQVRGLRASSCAATRAIGDNVQFEEHVSDQRRLGFEAASPPVSDLMISLADHFDRAVQGARRSHVPETFRSINALAHMSSTIEPNQCITRLERVDDAILRSGTDAAKLIQTMAEPSPDRTIVDPMIRALNAYPGARPMFACFSAEVAPDLATPEWLPRLISRLGLGHHALAVDEVGYFALMRYTVREVLDQAVGVNPLAIPTVFEARNSEFFLPAPLGHPIGFAVDLDPAAGRNWIREFLHARLTYTWDHMIRVVSLTGPTPAVDLIVARDAHLRRARRASDRPEYGTLMSGGQE